MGVLGIEISDKAVCLFGNGVSKADALDCLINSVSAPAVVTDREAFRQAIHKREAVMSTGVGSGIAIPHVCIGEVQRPVLGVGISPSGIDFAALDGEPVYIIVLFAMPAGSQKEYLSLLAQVMRALKDSAFREQLIACQTREEAASVLNGLTG